MKKVTRYTLLIIALIAFFGNTKAQDAFSMSTTYMQDGAPKTAVKNEHYADMDGSPYLYDGWAKGEAKLSDGKIYKNLYLRYDEVQGTVSFKYALTDTEMAFAIPAVEFTFTYIADNQIHDAHFLNGFDPVSGTNAFYQVLSNGNTKLLKRTVKKIIETTEFSTPTVNRRVEETTTYYIAKGKKLEKVKNDKKSVFEALNDKADKLMPYIADNKLNVKNDDDFVKVVDYYNSL